MKKLMKEVVNKVFTFLYRQDERAFIEAFVRMGGGYAARWDEPELVKDFVTPVKNRQAQDAAAQTRVAMGC